MSGVSDRLMRAALKYAEQFGFAVFPCHYSIAAAEGLRCSCGRRDCASPGKHPFTAHGLKDATKKPEVVADWWKKRLRANVAIATGTTSRIVVLDIDSRHGGDETLTALEGKYGKLPATPMVRTGSGGRHFFFKHPGGRVPNSAGRLGRGLDQRGDGGYIIGPPSLHLSGNHYTWGQSSRIDEIALADAPDWLLTWSVPLPAIRDKSAPEGRFDSLQPSAHRLDLARLAAGIAEGERDTELFRLACYLRRRGYTREQALPCGSRRGRSMQPSVSASRRASQGTQRVALRMSSELDILSEVQKLAALSPLEYEAQRKPAAKALSLRLPALDAEVAKHRPPPLVQARESLAPPPPKPWPAPVEARALLDDLRVYVERFVVVDEHALSAITLWVAFSYCFEVAETSPRLAIGSPTKRCGKTRLLELLSLLCPQAIAASNLTPSAIFRTIDAESCVLLIDEADTLDAASKSELRGILNSGHTRATAFVIRNVPVGERHWEPKKFSTWAPIAHAAIGRLPDTWRDRSVEIRMRRKPRTQTVERLTRRNVAAREQAATLASKLARFAADNLEALRNATPEPAELDSDRAVDNWELMLAIADLAGEQWPERAGAAAVALSRDGQASADDSPPILMLADIGEVFEDHFGENIGSTELCDRLNARELSPWSTFARGKGLTAARLARMLKDFEIYPRKSAARNEYLRGDFSEAFTRYVPVPPSQGSIAPQTLGRARRNAIPEVPSDGALKSAETRTESGSSGTMEVPDGGMGVDHDFPAGEEDGIGGEDEGPL